MRFQDLQWSVGYVEKSQDHSGCPVAEILLLVIWRKSPARRGCYWQLGNKSTA